MLLRSVQEGPFVELLVRSDKLQAGLMRAYNQVRQFGASVQAVGQRMVMAGVMAATPFALATARFATFDDKMRIVRAVTQGTEADFNKLSEVARDLGSTTSFTAVEVADLMGELGKAGFTVPQIESATAAVLNLARATGTDAKLAAAAMVRTLAQFGLSASESTRVANALTVAANGSLASVESLAESLSYAGAVAHDFGMSVEDTLAILGTLANLGIEGSMAGTALRRMLIITGAEAQKVGQIFGIAATDAAGNARPLVDMLGEIGDATRGLGTAARAAKFNELFGLLGITAATGISANVNGVRDLRRQMDGLTDVAGAQARMMDEGLGGSLRRVRGAIEGVAISVGDALSPALRLMGRFLVSGMNSFKEWVKDNQAAVVAIGLGTVAVIALGAALVSVGLLFKLAAIAVLPFIAVLKVLSLLMLFIKLQWFLLTTPIGLLLKALDIFGSAMVVSGVVSGRTFSILSDGFKAVAEIATTAVGAIREAITAGDWDGAAAIAWLGLKAAFQTGIAFVSIAWRNFSGAFVDTFLSAVAVCATVIESLLGFFRGVITFITTSIRNVLSSTSVLGGALRAVLRSIASAVGGAGAAQAVSAIEMLNNLAPQDAALPAGPTFSVAEMAAAENIRRLREREAANRADLAEAAAIRRELAEGIAEQNRLRVVRLFNEAQMRRLEEGMSGGAGGAPGAGPAPAVTSALAKLEAKGTFNPFAIFGLGAQNLTERIASATERAANTLDRIERQPDQAFA